MLTVSEFDLLAASLRELAPTGRNGFEGLVQRLISRVTGAEFFLAQSGAQSGRDMSSARTGATIIAVECKRYGKDRELDEDELKGKLLSAVSTIPGLDLWVLAASRPVPDQLYSGLQASAELLNVDVLALSLDGTTDGSLATLCAIEPGLVAAALRDAGVARADAVGSLLSRIQLRPEFERRRAELATALRGGGGIHSVRFQLEASLRDAFASTTKARASFGQAIDVGHQAQRGLLVERRAVFARLDEWLSAWPADHAGLAVTGEEGDGKTWAVGSWLANRISAGDSGPIPLWVPSRDATADEVEELVAQCFSRRLGQNPDRWRNRLRRWATAARGDQPLVLLVLDGINERHPPDWWRRIIEGLSAEPWVSAIAPLVTTRSTYWPRVAGYSHIEWHRVQVSGYDESELERALAQRELAREILPPEILPLVRKPRYLELAVQHRTAMVASGDITVPRLIYEDWRDRESRRAGLASEAEFQQAIATLAGIQRERQRLQPSDLAAATAGSKDGALLGELRAPRHRDRPFHGIVITDSTHRDRSFHAS